MVWFTLRFVVTLAKNKVNKCQSETSKGFRYITHTFCTNGICNTNCNLRMIKSLKAMYIQFIYIYIGMRSFVFYFYVIKKMCAIYYISEDKYCQDIVLGE